MKNIRRGIVLALCCLTAAFSFTSCSGGDSSLSSESSSVAAANVSCEEIMSSLLSEAENMPACSELKFTDNTFADSYEKYLTLLSPDDVEDFYFVYSDTATADEIMVVRLKDGADVSKLESALEKRTERRRKQFDTYDPEEAKRTGLAKIESVGPYVVYVICDNSGEVVDRFEEITAK